VLAGLDDAVERDVQSEQDEVDMSEQLKENTSPEDRALWGAQDRMVQLLPAAIASGFQATDREFKKRSKQSGSTATFAVIVGWELIVGNVGDSWAFLDTGAEVIQVTALPAPLCSSLSEVASHVISPTFLLPFHHHCIDAPLLTLGYLRLLYLDIFQHVIYFF
jgi:hypothetical protein